MWEEGEGIYIDKVFYCVDNNNLDCTAAIPHILHWVFSGENGEVGIQEGLP